MLFSLPNVRRRSVRDPDGEMAVVPKLLHGRNILRLVRQAIEVFEGYVGKTRAEYDSRALEAVMADYRLGRCIESCLLTSYSFVQPRLEDVLPGEEIAKLIERGLASPSDLRLALWDAANVEFGGFVPAAGREGLLARLAVEWGLEGGARSLERLLSLDSEGSAVLTAGEARPMPRDLMVMYNRGAVRTLLAHSERVVFGLQSLPGAALKRAYFVAKRRGVLVDLAPRREGGYVLELYGPEQAFGSADKYGQRLADVSISLLRSLISGGETGIEATAQLVLHDLPYRFHLTAEILGRLELAPERKEEKMGRIAEAGVTYTVGSEFREAEEAPGEEPSFDSLVEEKFYREHISLEKQGYTHGWRLEREPDPLLAPGIVLVPDFAFRRGETRVFMEIAGFWSPSYRERKLAKLRSLAEQSREEALVIAAPQDVVPLFAGLPYPVVPYKNRLRATDMLGVLDARYGQREERAEAAGERAAALRQAAQERGYILENEVAQTLAAFTRSELLESARSLDGEGCEYVAGVGLFSAERLNAVLVGLADAVEKARGKMALEDATVLLNAELGSPVDVEALVSGHAGLAVERPSLFDSYLVRTDE